MIFVFIEFLSTIKKLTLNFVLSFLLRDFNRQSYLFNDIHFVRPLSLEILISLLSVRRSRKIKFKKVKNITNLILSYELTIVKYLALLRQHRNKFAK